MRYLGLSSCFTVVVVTGTLQMVVVVVGGGATVVVVSPGIVVDVGSDVVVVGGSVVVTGVHVGRFFWTVVVVTGLRTGLWTGFFARGRWVLTTSVIVACHLTRVPAAGDWRRTTTHLPSVLPGPRGSKYSWTRFITAKVRARESPMSRGTRRSPRGLASDVRTVAWKCQGTAVPGWGD